MTEPTPLHTPSTSSEVRRRGGECLGQPVTAELDRLRTDVCDWCRHRKDGAEYAHHHRQEEQWACHRMEKDRIQAARPFGWRPARDSRPWCRHCPPTRGISARRAERAVRVGTGFAHGAGQKLENLIDVFTGAGADQRYRRAQFVRELAEIQFAAAIAQIVRHVQDDQRGQAQRQNGRGQHQVAAQVGGVQNQQDRLRFRRLGAGAVQYVVAPPAHLRSAD